MIKIISPISLNTFNCSSRFYVIRDLSYVCKIKIIKAYPEEYHALACRRPMTSQ